MLRTICIVIIVIMVIVLFAALAFIAGTYHMPVNKFT